MKYPDDFINQIICGDCLEVMREIGEKYIKPKWNIQLKKGVKNER